MSHHLKQMLDSSHWLWAMRFGRCCGTVGLWWWYSCKPNRGEQHPPVDQTDRDRKGKKYQRCIWTKQHFSSANMSFVYVYICNDYLSTKEQKELSVHLDYITGVAAKKCYKVHFQIATYDSTAYISFSHFPAKLYLSISQIICKLLYCISAMVLFKGLNCWLCGQNLNWLCEQSNHPMWAQ